MLEIYNDNASLVSYDAGKYSSYIDAKNDNALCIHHNAVDSLSVNTLKYLVTSATNSAKYHAGKNIKFMLVYQLTDYSIFDIYDFSDNLTIIYCLDVMHNKKLEV